MNEFKDIFPRGGENTAFAQYFVGQSYLNMLSTEQVVIGNVTFESGCCNNWHIHHAKSGGGQILLCTSGRGLLSGVGQGASGAASGRRGKHPGGGQTLARSRTRQLVLPSGGGGSRRGDEERVVRTGI